MKRNYALALLAIVFLAFAPAQIMKTSLRVTVLNELGNPVEGATIHVYTTDQDYRASANPAVPAATTNAKGVAVIKDLEAKAYFLDVEKDDMNNRGAGYQTDVLKENRINKINVIIE